VQLTDADALQRYIWTSYSREGVEDLLLRVLEMVASNRAIGLVMARTADNEAFAYGQITRWPRVVEISDLAVAADQRGQGVGSALIEKLIQIADEWQMPHIEIGVARSNTRAFALYQRLGFTELRTVLLDLGHGLEPVLYLTLTRPFAAPDQPI
jgi:ribosomal protein S18 acetylase RimI-like enzyme